MAQLTRQGKVDPLVREFALSLVRGVPENDYGKEIAVMFYYVRDNIRYVRDIRGIETVQTPEKTLQYKQGDCDDQSVLLATLLEIVGNETRFKAVGYTPRFFQHVYVEVYINGQWIALDPIVKMHLGWSPPGMVSAMFEGV